jgi:(1->4)-alpha-D-glucan 1-alpha-D-glucosylmutase
MTDTPPAQDRPRFVPLSTYRLQVYSAFPLTAARDVVPYLASLGVSACYTSPYFTAVPGSTHGYDVCDHNEINPEAGGMEALQEFKTALASHGLKHIVDFVPNHMGIGTGGNARWNDVLENGPSSPDAAFFDIEWAPEREGLQAKLLLPILGDQYGRVLERGELRVVFRDGQLRLRYNDTELPINPRQAPRAFKLAIDPLTMLLGQDNPALHEFLSIVSSLRNLPPYTEERPDLMAERRREKDVARKRLVRLVSETPVIGEQIAAALQTFNGEPGRPETFDQLHELLESQPYRLAYWRTASHEINYRRFFDVNTLAGLRVERAEVFAALHGLLEKLLRDGTVDGVRVDHPDGLFDPARYLEMLQDLAATAWGIQRQPQPDGRPGRPLYVVAEKILSGHERLPRRWAVHGTTGYNYLNDLNGVFVNPAHGRRMRRAYAKLTGQMAAFDDVVYASKRLIMDTAMASELHVLAHLLNRIGKSSRRSRDFTVETLRDVITEVVACFPVYRTYVDEQGWTAADRSVVEQTIERARRRNPAMERSLFDFFREVMLPRDPEEAGSSRPGDRRDGYPPADANEARERLKFAMKFQQYTGPVQAKGVEDTAFYRYNLLLSLNEVGGDPAQFGRTPAEFHQANAHRLRNWPWEMIATATHDTKLGEDVRARLNALSELADLWSRQVGTWMRLNRHHRTLVDGEPAPDRNDEYRFYQALIGIWPADPALPPGTAPPGIVDRLQAYMIKAVKEAKLHTSWLTPNEPYEQAMTRFVEGALADAKFLLAFQPFQTRIAAAGMVNSLAQLTLKLGSPGVPDFYQGTELWDLTLVDPDNRRPVDFDARRGMLAAVEGLLALDPEARGPAIAQKASRWHDGAIKLAVTLGGLRLRREWPEVFLSGDYVPLDVETTVDASLIAFARVLDDRVAVFVAPRLCTSLTDVDHPLPTGAEKWKTSRVLLPAGLADRVFRHEITGAEVRPVVTGTQAWMFAGQLFETIPLAILRSEGQRLESGAA